MPRAVTTIDVADQRLHLLPDRAVWWPARCTLLLADLHLGKASAFRSAGVPVPERTTRADLARLDALLEQFAPERMVILGDLIHAPTGRTAVVLEQVAAWRDGHRSLDILLIRGNHDRRSGDPPTSWRMTCSPGAHEDGPFVYRHEPEPHERGYVLAGHLHPAAALTGAGPPMKAPCFWFGSGVGVLPAFGSFTGTKVVRPKRGDRVFVVGCGEVVDVSPSAATPASGRAK